MVTMYAFKRILFVACLFLLGCGAASADDGYDLWLNYQPLDDGARCDACRTAFSSLVLSGDSATCQIIREEWKRAMAGLCGAELSVVETLSSGSALIIATPSTLPDGIPSMDTGVLAALGDEGCLIRSLEINGADHGQQ